MPTIFSHAIFASALGGAFQSTQFTKLPVRFWILTPACAVLPDLDVVAFAFGVQYSSMWGHRGFTHSLSFALLTGLIVSIVFFSSRQFSKWNLAVYFSAVSFTHPLLDMLTNGGLGVALLAPFSNERFFFPWRPIEASPIGTAFLSNRGLNVVLNEIVIIWLPALVMAFAALLVQRKRTKARRTKSSRT